MITLSIKGTSGCINRSWRYENAH